MSINEKPIRSLGYQQITSLSSAVGFTSIPDGATLAIVQCESQAVRWRDDGTNPTASVGMRLLTTDSGLRYEGQLSRIKFIEETGSAKLNVAFFG